MRESMFIFCFIFSLLRATCIYGGGRILRVNRTSTSVSFEPKRIFSTSLVIFSGLNLLWCTALFSILYYGVHFLYERLGSHISFSGGFHLLFNINWECGGGCRYRFVWHSMIRKFQDRRFFVSKRKLCNAALKDHRKPVLTWSMLLIIAGSCLDYPVRIHSEFLLLIWSSECFYPVSGNLRVTYMTI